MLVFRTLVLLLTLVPIVERLSAQGASEDNAAEEAPTTPVYPSIDYTGACDGVLVGADGMVCECPGERPIGFDDGSCSCAKDPQCQ